MSGAWGGKRKGAGRTPVVDREQQQAIGQWCQVLYRQRVEEQKAQIDAELAKCAGLDDEWKELQQVPVLLRRIVTYLATCKPEEMPDADGLRQAFKASNTLEEGYAVATSRTTEKHLAAIGKLYTTDEALRSIEGLRAEKIEGKEITQCRSQYAMEALVDDYAERITNCAEALRTVRDDAQPEASRLAQKANSKRANVSVAKIEEDAADHFSGLYQKQISRWMVRRWWKEYVDFEKKLQGR